MVRIILLLLLLALVARALVRLMKGVLEGAGYTREAKGSLPLVRDPVCGTFVAPSRALAAGSGDGTRYFCSENCRQQWTNQGSSPGARP